MNKNVLITGADKGLGLALTELYLKQEFCVYSCLYQQPTDAILKLKEQYKENLVILQMDVGDDDSVRRATEILSGLTDSIDILINNAGVHFKDSHKSLEDIDFEVALKTININSLGPLRVIKALLPLVENSTSKVIADISSEAGSISECWRDKQYDYCMSKAALNMQCNILQRYLKPKGIKVLAIHPGWMRTDMGGADAEIEPKTSAEGISKLIEKYSGDIEGPIYMDYTGKLMSW